MTGSSVREIRTVGRDALCGLFLLFPLLFLLETIQVAFLAPDAFASCRLDARGAISYGAALHPMCPMLPYERVSGLSSEEGLVPLAGRAELSELGRGPLVGVQVERGSSRRRVVLELRGPDDSVRHLEAVAAIIVILFSSALAMFCLFGLRGEAGVCAAGVCITLGMDLASNVQSIHSPLLELMATFAHGAAPAALSHLLIVYPRELYLVRELPWLKFVPYGLATGLVALTTLLLVRDSRLWEVPERLLGIWLILGVGLLALSVVAKPRSSSADQPAIRSAWLFVAGGGLIAVLLAVFSAEGMSPAARRGFMVLIALAIAVVSFVSSRRLGGPQEKPARWALTQFLHTGISLSILMVVLKLVPGVSLAAWQEADLVLVAVGVFCLIAWLEQGRILAWRMARHGLDPGAPRFEELQRTHEARLEKARDADGLLRALAGTCAKALDCEGMTAFLRMGDSGWRLAYQSGTPICGEDQARAAELTLEHHGKHSAARRVVHLSWLSSGLGHETVLHNAKVGLLVGLYPSGGEARALLLGTGLCRSFDVNSETRRFLELLGSQTSHAIERWDFEQKLVGSARMAAMGHAAAGLAHDLGRPLGEIYLEARREDSSESMLRIERCASECIDLLDAFVGGARASHERAARLDSVLQAALDRITHLEASRRAVVRLAPSLPCVSDPRSVQRVFENLLENAFQWNSGTEPVEVTATESGGWAVVRIIDHGPGMSEDEMRDAFGRFRSGRRSTGLGLAICRDITTKLGASISLGAGLGGGTVATVSLPAPGGSRGA